ncbi:MAG TPA: 1,4-dihydroxy-2-naphthoate polyprenyltransferase [Acidimicrobiia bacterium]|jgi:1,4-dihydroxy-2-naphthoate octaprenyltransferase
MAGPTVAPSGWRLWVAGARPKTLGAAIAPVVVGTAAAHGAGTDLSWGRAVLALVVALSLQVGVNYANDYSDGVRGADDDRRGPLRLTASGLVRPELVRRAAAIALGVGAAAGVALAVLVTPWLLVVGAAAIAAAVLYTGGPRPYGYSGLGEVVVFLFFGVVATAGSAFVQGEEVPATAWWGSIVVGLLACAILLANNVRDVASDAASGKRTLVVRLGERRARRVYVACLAGAGLGVVGAALDAPWALLALAATPLGVAAGRAMVAAQDAPRFVRVLVATARLQLVTALLLAVGLWVS